MIERQVLLLHDQRIVRRGPLFDDEQIVLNEQLTRIGDVHKLKQRRAMCMRLVSGANAYDVVAFVMRQFDVDTVVKEGKDQLVSGIQRRQACEHTAVQVSEQCWDTTLD